MKRRAGLTALFWRYLLTTCALLAAIAVLWWGTLTALLASGFVLPAYTAERGAAEVLRAVADGTLDTADIPHYYRWAILTEDGQVTDPGNMDARHLGYARSALAGDYYVLGGTMPSVLVECGFLSNPREEALLLDPAYQQQIGQAIADGLEAYEVLLARTGQEDAA